MATKRYCDRCGMAVNWSCASIGLYSGNKSIISSIDACDSCIKSFNTWLKQTS